MNDTFLRVSLFGDDRPLDWVPSTSYTAMFLVSVIFVGTAWGADIPRWFNQRVDHFRNDLSTLVCAVPSQLAS